MKIKFLPLGKVIHANAGENLLNIAKQAGILIDASCGGIKKCGNCKVKIIGEQNYPLTKTEQKLLTPFEIENHYRLACCFSIQSDLEVYVPDLHDSSVRKKNMIKLPENFTSEKAPSTSRCYGVAFDIGTTTVVGMLWNLINHTIVDTEARTNYQTTHGADVISRIQFCMKNPSHTKLMQEKVIQCLNDILEDIYIRNHIQPKQVSEVTLVGNTTMSHLILGISPESLAFAPFTPVFCEAQMLSAKELGIWVNPGANVFLLPNIAGHVGSDIVGMLLSTRIYQYSGCHIAIDIGTNGEIVAIKDGKMVTCSTAAGPAFEGASIYHGMRAASGAIESVQIENGDVFIKTIDDMTPVGLCGSGLIDAVAQLLEARIIESNGRILTCKEAILAGVPSSLAKRIITTKAGLSFVLAHNESDEPIVLTQQDIREVQLAKGAILAGIKTLMKTLDITTESINSILLAGAFGNYINKQSALRIGLFPQVPIEKIISVGNAAGTGSSMALLSDTEKEIAIQLAKTTEHIELSMNMDFQEFYISAMSF